MFGKKKHDDALRHLAVQCAHSPLSELTLEQLFDKAEQFGKVRLAQVTFGTSLRWLAFIEFNCIPGCALEAKSDLSHTSKHDALTQAIERANSIVSQFK